MYTIKPKATTKVLYKELRLANQKGRKMNHKCSQLSSKYGR